MPKKAWGRIVLAAFGLSLAVTAGIRGPNADGPDLVLLFTHDLHSAVLPFRVERDDGRIDVRGGFARIASMIREQRSRHGDRVLVLDGGDAVMGTFFQTMFRDEAPEWRLLRLMGFDAATFGNHEFDFGPGGLARTMAAARRRGGGPPFLAANILFDPDDPRDDDLEAAFRDDPVREYLVFERNGLRIGVFGLITPDAADDAPDAEPVIFDDHLRRASEVTAVLRDREKVDLVVCLSHGGTSPDPDRSEDEILARSVPGLDVIVSAHSHTRLSAPLAAGNAVLVSCGSRGEELGVVGLRRGPSGRFEVTAYELHPVTDGVPEDPVIAAEIASFMAVMDERLLSLTGFRRDGIAAESAFALRSRLYGRSPGEGQTALGDLVVDALRWAVGEAEKDLPPAPPIVIHPFGHLRDSLLPGLVTVEDVFRVLSLGLGPDDRPGYPLVSVWLSGREIRRLFEVETTIAPGNTDAHLAVAGAVVRFNPRRVPFDRVAGVEVEEPDGSLRPLDPNRLYRVVTNIYMARMIGYISRASHGILKFELKDAGGSPIKDDAGAIIDGNRAEPGIQEIKEWIALVRYLRSLPDIDGNGIPDIPRAYASPGRRLKSEPSWNPLRLLKAAHGPTVVVLALLVGLPAIVVTIIRIVIRRRRTRRA